jgi:hypothetical protein
MGKLEDIVRRYYEAFNARDWEAYATLFTKDCVIEAPGIKLTGIDGARGFDRAWTGAFPHVRIESLRSREVAGFGVVTSNWIHGGKHDGPLKSPAGEIPPTHAEFQAPYCASFRFDGDRISQQRLLYEAESIPYLLGIAK